ncbi:hypothetical protein [Bellilinea sp.]
MKINRLAPWGMALILLATAVFPLNVLAQTQPPDEITPQDTSYTVFLPMVRRSSTTTTPTPTPRPTIIPNPQLGNIIDHTSIELFEQIPDTYIQQAARIRSLFRHASVGANIKNGLDCLRGITDQNGRRPDFCDRGLSSQEILYNSKYDNRSWIFEFHSPPPGQNPGWWNKVNYFVQAVDQNAHLYDVMSFKFGYVDAQIGSDIDNAFFSRNPRDPYPGIEDIEALMQRHPDKIIPLWTMGLAVAIGTPDSTSFNEQMREYARQNNVILMDIADILSHRPDGSPCFDNQGRGLPALCTDYTEEVNGGHLNARGSLRMAKAYWLLMAYLAGWQGP